VELQSKYGVSRKLGKQWIEERALLPLLDGLDEVAPERQVPCVHQINAYLTGASSPLYTVVCSRIAEYENYQTPLQLNGAVYLTELSDRQIQDYLVGIERQELWPLVRQSPQLLELVRAPLLLSMAVLTDPGGETEQWQGLQRADEPLEYLLDGYVVRMLHRQLVSRSYSRHQLPTARQTRSWLIWLAKQMEQASQGEFLIEEMQPPMLPDGKRWRYRLIGGLVAGLMFGLIAGLMFGLRSGLMGGLMFALIAGLMGGLMFALINGIDSAIKPVEALKFSWTLFTKNFLLAGLMSGLMGGLMSGLMGGLIFGLGNGLIFGLLSGGRACIRHLALRYLLYQNKSIPWNYARFLNYSTERLLLQRVGGRYRFIHKLLQDHFARQS
jgi:hypothetical protein